MDTYPVAVETKMQRFFGWLSDRIGRKPIIITACLVAAASYFPAVKALTHFANPAYEAALASAPISVASFSFSSSTARK